MARRVTRDLSDLALLEAEVIIAVQPDETIAIVKGERIVRRIASSDRERRCPFVVVQVDTWEQMEALRARFVGPAVTPR